MQDWIPLLKDWFDSFISYFQAQSLPVQVLLGAMIVLGIIVTGFVIYGVLWLTFQLVKAAIVGVVLLVYFTGALVGFFFMLFIDAERIPGAWAKVKHDMAWWIDRSYPPRHPRPATACAPLEAGCLDASPPPTRVVIEPRVVPRAPEKTREPGTGFFCSSCGAPFSDGMQGMLQAKHACYCETCGQQFVAKASIATAGA